MSFRSLTTSEIATLEGQGCRAQDWSRVEACDPFIAERVVNCDFSGDIRIGLLEGEATFAGGAVRDCGLYDSRIHNCRFGDNVFVARVGSLANYTLEDGVIVDGVGQLVVDGETTFGNGVEIEVMNEGGGRPLKIFDRLSSQVAHLLVVCRHDAAMIERLETLVDQYVVTKKSSTGLVGKGARIENTTAIVNVSIGQSALISGATELRDGSLASNAAAPVTVGSGVMARSFIVLSGSQIKDSAVIDRCFVGQACKIGKQFSAENSAFFANCEAFHGEGCSVYAGPHTVTHHKSTLLIAGMFSFYNAGSGTNQSNHMYKLGPLHQGALLRGSKTGSFSYLLWPSQVGPFSVVVGKHMTNFDTTDLPFSYLQVKNERTVVTPAMNLFTVGTRRDAAKWPSRDGRVDADRLDQLRLDLFSPYIVEKTLNGIDALTELYGATPKDKETVYFNGALVGRLMLRTACKYYQLVVNIFLGECMIALLQQADGSLSKVRERLVALASTKRSGKWVDLSGLMAPADVVEELMADIGAGSLAGIEDVLDRFVGIHSQYEEEKLRWFAAILKERRDIAAADLTIEQVTAIINDWLSTRVKLNNMTLQDATKEFNTDSQIGYGLDEQARESDFLAVRGSYEDNSFVREVKKESEEAAALAQALLNALHE